MPHLLQTGSIFLNSASLFENANRLLELNINKNITAGFEKLLINRSEIGKTPRLHIASFRFFLRNAMLHEIEKRMKTATEVDFAQFSSVLASTGYHTRITNPKVLQRKNLDQLLLDFIHARSIPDTVSYSATHLNFRQNSER